MFPPSSVLIGSSSSPPSSGSLSKDGVGRVVLNKGADDVVKKMDEIEGLFKANFPNNHFLKKTEATDEDLRIFNKGIDQKELKKIIFWLYFIDEYFTQGHENDFFKSIKAYCDKSLFFKGLKTSHEYQLNIESPDYWKEKLDEYDKGKKINTEKVTTPKSLFKALIDVGLKPFTINEYIDLLYKNLDDFHGELRKKGKSLANKDRYENLYQHSKSLTAPNNTVNNRRYNYNIFNAGKSPEGSKPDPNEVIRTQISYRTEEIIVEPFSLRPAQLPPESIAKNFAKSHVIQIMRSAIDRSKKDLKKEEDSTKAELKYFKYLLIAIKLGGINDKKEQFKKLLKNIDSSTNVENEFKEAKKFSKLFQEESERRNVFTGRVADYHMDLFNMEGGLTNGKKIVGMRTKRIPLILVIELAKEMLRTEDYSEFTSFQQAIFSQSLDNDSSQVSTEYAASTAPGKTRAFNQRLQDITSPKKMESSAQFYSFDSPSISPAETRATTPVGNQGPSLTSAG